MNLPGFGGIVEKPGIKALGVDERSIRYTLSQNNISIPPMAFPKGMLLALVRFWPSKNEHHNARCISNSLDLYFFIEQLS